MKMASVQQIMPAPMHFPADEGAGRGEVLHCWLEPVKESLEEQQVQEDEDDEEQPQQQDYEGHPADPVQEAAGARPACNVEDVSDEVMRLRLLKSQHDELRAKLNHA